MYRVTYEDAWITSREDAVALTTEYYPSEREALTRVRELVDSGVHRDISLVDGRGVVLAGVRLQLRLGISTFE